MNDSITRAMVEAYQLEHECSLPEAIRTLKQRQKLARHAQMQSTLEAATTFDELKTVLQYVMNQLQ